MRLAQPIETKTKDWLRGVDLNHRPLGYEPNRTPLTASDSNALASPSHSKPRENSSVLDPNWTQISGLPGELPQSVFPACIPGLREETRSPRGAQIRAAYVRHGDGGRARESESGNASFLKHWFCLLEMCCEVRKILKFSVENCAGCFPCF